MKWVKTFRTFRNALKCNSCNSTDIRRQMNAYISSKTGYRDYIPVDDLQDEILVSRKLSIIFLQFFNIKKSIS